MKPLIICIELLFGHYFIEINPNYIATYWTEEGIEVKREINLIHREKQVLYVFDADKNIRYSGSIHTPEGNDNVTLINSELIDEDYKYLNFNCEKYKSEYNITNYLNGYGNSNVVIENAYAEIDVIDQYVQDKKLRAKLIWIGTDYLKTGKYALETYETTHCRDSLDVKRKVLLSKLVSLTEVENLSPEIANIIEKVNGIDH